jgi:hypothetical protein
VTEQIMSLVWCPAIDCLVDNGDNIVLRDVCDRPRGPSIDKLAAQLPLYNCGLSRFGNMPLYELLSDDSKGVFLLTQFCIPMALLLSAGVYSSIQ